jgi:hypothetical protein
MARLISSEDIDVSNININTDMVNDTVPVNDTILVDNGWEAQRFVNTVNTNHGGTRIFIAGWFIFIGSLFVFAVMDIIGRFTIMMLALTTMGGVVTGFVLIVLGCRMLSDVE